MRARHIVGLDLVRFAAACSVMFFHLAFWPWSPEAGLGIAAMTERQRIAALIPVAWFGWVGVQVFFVLSGFVIISSCAKTHADFLRSRIVRLMPAAWICATITLVWLILAKTYPPSEIGRRYLYSLTLWPIGPWVDGVYWTLGIEIAFYFLIWGMLFFFNGRHIPALLSTIGLYSSVYWFLKLARYLIDGATSVPFVNRLDDRVLDLLLIYHGCLFAVGGLLWFALNRGWSRRDALVITGCMIASAIQIGFLAARYVPLIGSAWQIIVPILLWLILVFAMVLAVRHDGTVTRYINSKLARRIGLATYPLYLLHSVGGAMFERWGASVGMNQTAALILAMALAIGLSLIVARLEEPIQKRLRTVLGGSKPLSINKVFVAP